MGETRYYENPDIWERSMYMENEYELRRFVACARLIPGTVRSLLDVGTGNGAFLRFLEDRGLPIDLVGLERSETAIKHSLCRARIHLGSAENVPFRDRSFDLVSALEVIEHLPYGVYEKALQEMERVAKEYIIVSVPYKERRRQVRCPYCSCEFNPWYHMRSFDEVVLSNLFESFQAIRFDKVGVVEDYVLGPYLRDLRNVYQSIPGSRSEAKVNRAFPPKALCPQCGFSRAGGNYRTTSTAKSKTANILGLVKRVLPKQREAQWIVALYKRIS